MASEPGSAQTSVVSSGQRCDTGVERPIRAPASAQPHRMCIPKDVWKASPETVTAGSGMYTYTAIGSVSRAGHVQPGLKLGSPLPKANYTTRPIAYSTVRER